MKTFTIKTLGCKVNQYESEKIRAVLHNAGYKEEPFGQEADVHVINTCSVTKAADAKSRQAVAGASKTEGEVLVTGCAVENSDFNLNPSEIVKIPNKAKVRYFEKMTGSHRDGTHYSRARPLIQVQDGCNQSCSYCIVPKLRGRSTSTGANDVINEIKAAAKAGYEEFVLTGINLGQYNDGRIKLAELLNAINSIEGKFQIRLSSIEANCLSDYVIKNIFTPDSRIVPHLHIPLQSGSDSILKAMNRPYSINDFKKVVNKIKKHNADIALTTDCIVGFPGEAEDDFRKTCDFISKTGFSKVHIFRFSERPFTKADSMSEKVSEKSKKERSYLLQKIADEKRLEFIERQIGRTRPVICETEKKGFIYGLTDNYIRVRFKGKVCLLKQKASVKILNASLDVCEGEFDK